MPNYCDCALEVTGPGAEELLALIATKDHLFEALVPMPEPLRGISIGMARTPDGICHLWREGPNHEVMPLTAEDEAGLIAQYGTADWYEWSKAHWGTKWDPTYEREGNTLRFDTAWCPPRQFLLTVSARFPGATLLLGYCEGGMGYWGTDTYVGGEEVAGEYHDGGIYADDFDEDADDWPVLPEVREHLDRFGIGTGG